MYLYDLKIAGMRLRILAPCEIIFPESFRPFLDTEQGTPDIRIDVLMGSPEDSGFHRGQLCRITHAPNGEDIIREKVAGVKNHYRLYIPHRLGPSVAKHGNWLLYLPLEQLLLPFGRVILHASAVIHDGQAYVFTAPSGTGKSTQADIWNREFGAEIMNGDKVVISVEEHGCTAHGSPVAGSSGIYKNISAPIAAIIQLKQSDRNSIVKANDRSGYMALYSGMVKSNYDPVFNQRLLPCIEQIIETVPVLTLYCRPEKAAADCVLNWMESNDRPGQRKRGKRDENES